MSGLRQLLAFGTGVGIEVTPDALHVAIARVRPGGTDLAAAETIPNYAGRPAAEWGNDFAALLRRHAAGHLAATVVLPRREVTVRVLPMPGVAPKDLDNAIRLQIDSLHPYPEADAVWAWSRMGTGNAVLIAIARQSVVERLIERFTEAGIKIAGFTFTAAALHGALRLYGDPPKDGFLAVHQTADGVEVYGESPSRPLYSATYDTAPERAATVAASELRLGDSVLIRELAGILPSPRRVPDGGGLTAPFFSAYLGAIAGAAPRLALPLNLLPEAMRSTSSRWIYVPTAVLGSLLVIGLASLGFYQRYEDQRYLRSLEAEIARIEPRARQVQTFDTRTAQARARIQLLDQFQSRTKIDLDALREATRLIPPPGWLNTLELSRSSLVVAGEADQATGLLKALDSSPQFANSEFLVPLSRVGNAEIFRIRAAREGAPQ